MLSSNNSPQILRIAFFMWKNYKTKITVCIWPVNSVKKKMLFIISPERVFICKVDLKRRKSESFITLKEIKEDIKTWWNIRIKD